MQGNRLESGANTVNNYSVLLAQPKNNWHRSIHEVSVCKPFTINTVCVFGAEC